MYRFIDILTSRTRPASGFSTVRISSRQWVGQVCVWGGGRVEREREGCVCVCLYMYMFIDIVATRPPSDPSLAGRSPNHRPASGREEQKWRERRVREGENNVCERGSMCMRIHEHLRQHSGPGPQEISLPVMETDRRGRNSECSLPHAMLPTSLDPLRHSATVNDSAPRTCIASCSGSPRTRKLRLSLLRTQGCRRFPL